MSYDDAIAELEEQIKQQAAVIEQMREALKAVLDAHNAEARAASALANAEENFTDHRAELNAYSKAIVAASKVDHIAQEAIALQPCPEVLNKIRVDAVREAAKWVGFTPNCNCNLHMMDFAQRIEKGEA